MDNYESLVQFLKLFINRPYYLGKFLLEHNAVNKNFLKKIANSKNIEQYMDDYYMKNITDMEQSYSQFFDTKNLSFHEQEVHFNTLLQNYISEDNFEKAIEVRDYMLSQKMEIKK